METPTARPPQAGAGIQPCGFLVAVGQDWRVAHVSANVADHFADCAGVMIGQPLAEYFGAAAVHSLRNQLALMRDPRGRARLFSLTLAGMPKPFDVSLHGADGTIVLEVLPAAHAEAGDPAGMVGGMASLLDGHDDAAALVQAGARQLRALTGLDRVTIFRTCSGTTDVAAHDGRGAPLAARHCPHAALRLIGDADGPCVPIAPGTGATLVDRALLRSCDAAEREWLRAEGAAACLILPLRSAGRPWGVAVCLNATARRPMLDRIAAAELFADMVAMRIELSELRSR